MSRNLLLWPIAIPFGVVMVAALGYLSIRRSFDVYRTPRIIPGW